MPAIRYDWFEQAGMTEALGIGHDRISTFESKAGVVDVNPVLAPGRFFVSYSTIGIPDLEEALGADRQPGSRRRGADHRHDLLEPGGRPCYHRAWGNGYEGRDPDWPVPAYREWERCHGPGGRCTEHLIRMYQEDVFGETRFDELTTRYRGALESIHGKFFYRMITSDADVDDAWDDYVAEWLAAGGQALHDELARLDYTVADLVAGKVQR